MHVWSWVKGTPQTQKLGGIKDSTLPAFSQSANQQKSLLGRSRRPLFYQMKLHLFTQGFFSYAGLAYTRCMKPHQTYQKKTSRTQFSRSSQIAKGGLRTCLLEKEQDILSISESAGSREQWVGKKKAHRIIQGHTAKAFRRRRWNAFPQGGACQRVHNACQTPTHPHSDPF